MNPRRLTWLGAAVAGIFVLIGGWVWLQERSRPRLPEAASYSHLPAQFNARLAVTRREAAVRHASPEAVRRLARLYQANRLDREARTCYSWLGQSEGGLSAQDHYFLADLALNASDLPEAQAELRVVLQMEPTYLPARVILAESLFKSGQEAAAAVEYEALVAREPDHPQALLGLARLALQRNDDAAAIARLERVLAVHPAITSAAALLAQVMTRHGENERAAALTEWSRQKRDPVPPDPWLGELLTACYDIQRLTLRFEELVYSGQMEEARPLLERVVELDPHNWLPHLLKGWTLARAHREADAIVEYRLALEKSGDPERIVPLLVPCLLGLNRIIEAVEAVESALRSHPDSVALLMIQADLAVQQGDNTRTRTLLTALLKKEPYLYTANMNLAKILWAENERAEAVVCLTRIAKAFPADVASRGLLGQYYLEKNEADAAILPLEQALPLTAAGSAAWERLSALLSSAYLQAGAARVAATRPEEAIAYYEKAGRLSPAGMEALAGLAGEWVQTKQFRLAADALTRMAGLQPENPTILISLGDVLYQNGDAAARVHWEQALKLVAPADTALRTALAARLNGPITPELFQ